MNTRTSTKQPVVIGLIHAKWCGHCRNLMPIWHQMRNNISQKPYQPPPQYMEVEQSNLDMLDNFNQENSTYLKGQRIQSDGFPTIFKIRDGNIDYYKDMREPITMEKWFMDGQPQKRTTILTIRPKTKRYRNRRKSASSKRRRRTIRRKIL